MNELIGLVLGQFAIIVMAGALKNLGFHPDVEQMMLLGFLGWLLAVGLRAVGLP